MNTKNILIGIVVLVVVVAAVLFAKNAISGTALPFFKTSTATVNSQRFNLYIAKTNKDKEIGLSGRDSLPKDYGMLFPFEHDGYYSFWMKNMKFPIDIIYIYDNKVVEVFKNAQPPKSPSEMPQIFRPTEKADTVLEINAGLADKYNIKKGTEVKVTL